MIVLKRKTFGRRNASFYGYEGDSGTWETIPAPIGTETEVVSGGVTWRCSYNIVECVPAGKWTGCEVGRTYKRLGWCEPGPTLPVA